MDLSRVIFKGTDKAGPLKFYVSDSLQNQMKYFKIHLKIYQIALSKIWGLDFIPNPKICQIKYKKKFIKQQLMVIYTKNNIFVNSEYSEHKKYKKLA